MKMYSVFMVNFSRSGERSVMPGHCTPAHRTPARRTMHTAGLETTCYLDQLSQSSVSPTAKSSYLSHIQPWSLYTLLNKP